MGNFPDIGDTINLPEGKAKVTAVDIFNDFVHFWVTDKAEMIEKPLTEVDRYRK
jgi:cell fate regulator YaaT (PSP1 superfamily)